MELEFDEEILQELEDAGYDSELYQLVCEAENYIMSVGEFLDAGAQRVGDLADWAAEFCFDVYGCELRSLPAFIANHIDWKAVAFNELLTSGDYSCTDDFGGGYIVWRRN